MDHRRNPRNVRKIALWDRETAEHARVQRALAEVVASQTVTLPEDEPWPDVIVTLTPDPEACNGEGAPLADLSHLWDDHGGEG